MLVALVSEYGGDRGLGAGVVVGEGWWEDGGRMVGGERRRMGGVGGGGGVG